MNRLHGRSGQRLAGLLVVAVAVWFTTASGLALQGTRIQTLRDRGQALFEEKSHAAAATTFEQVVGFPEATAVDWTNLALARYEAAPPGDAAAYESVLVLLDRAAALAPTHAPVHYLRGLTYMQLQRPADALPAYREAAALDPTDPAILLNLASTLLAQGSAEEAAGVFEAVEAMGFDVGQQHYVSAVYQRATMSQRAGDRDGFVRRITGYQEVQQRLSQAQRAVGALEAGRNKRIVVPTRSLVSPSSAAAATVRFETRRLADSGPAVVVDDPGDGEVVVFVVGARSEVISLSAPTTAVPWVGDVAAVGDADRDGLADVFVAGADGALLYARTAADSMEFVAVTSAAFPDSVTSAVWVDADHDGDLDLLTTSATGPGVRWARNLGARTFEDATAGSGLDRQESARGLAWADLDGDNDTDLIVVRAEGSTDLFTNVRGGRFEEIGAAVGARGVAVRDVALEDFDNDGDIDLAFATDRGVEIRHNQGDGTFAAPRAVSALATERLRSADFDNDGWTDLVGSGAGAVTVWIQRGGGDFVAVSAGSGTLADVADGDSDGAVDLFVDDDGLQWRRQPAPLGHWLRVSLAGVKNNPLGIGSTVELKAEGAYQKRVQRRRWLHFGTGAQPRADVLRVTWPNGIVQNQTDLTLDRELDPIGEVERLEGSCPLLYTWDGERWRFINEVLGVAPLGMPLDRETIHPADFDEYVPVPGNALRARDDGYEIRFTEELRETGYLDALRLLAIDHPVGTTVIVDEKFVAPPHPQFRLMVLDEPLPVGARDQNGNDWSDELAAVDGEWARPFQPLLYEGLATAHSLEFTLDEARSAETVHLFLTGWVYWATGSINLQVAEDPRVAFAPVRLEVPDGAGGWRTAIADVGLPNAKNSRLFVDLSDHLRRDDPRVRIVTTMRLYWDAAVYSIDARHPRGLQPAGSWQGAWGVPHAGTLRMRSTAGAAADVRVTVLEPARATLGWRGFSELQRTAEGYETFAYERVGQSAPWNQHRGSYTRYGPVDDLLDAADDRLVIVGTGDELQVRFTGDLPALEPGWQRDWLVYLNGWVKDGDPNTLHGDRVEPLPFHAMTAYPYAPGETYPTTPALETWRRTYNTRPARAVNPPLRDGR